jgi:hypothetical protein
LIILPPMVVQLRTGRLSGARAHTEPAPPGRASASSAGVAAPSRRRAAPG